jgi:hypothetical protein
MDTQVGRGVSFRVSVRSVLVQLATVFGLLAGAAPAVALPSFATQTGYACDRCHTIGFGPALTPYGRQFKLNGYVWGDAPSTMPLAVMVMGTYTRTRSDQPDPPASGFSTNGNGAIDQTSLFIAGRLTSSVGVFAQAVTYSGVDRVATWDNTDLRWAKPVSFGESPAVIGVSVNNNPTVQDLWNSTPAWGFPYIGSSLAPTPSAGPLIAGLGGTVLGVTAYTMVNDHLYLEAGGYRGLSDHWLGNVGLTADDSPHISGVAPYWRAAWQYDAPVHHASVGTFGMSAKLQADPTIAVTDDYRDIGIDATYQYAPNGPHQLAANISLTHEQRELHSSFATGGSDAVGNHLTFVNADVTYAFERTWSVALGLFDVGGSSNAALYGTDPVAGSANGSPDSRGYTAQLEYIPFGKVSSFARPWLNLRVGLQYTGYTKFNGGTTNYDGAGRNASDNNTLFAYLWLIM